MKKRTRRTRTRTADIAAELAMAAPMPLTVVSSRGRVVYVNEAFASHFMPSRNQLVGQAAADLLSKTVLEALRRAPASPQRWVPPSGRVQMLESFRLRNGFGIASHWPDEPIQTDDAQRVRAALNSLRATTTQDSSLVAAIDEIIRKLPVAETEGAALKVPAMRAINDATAARAADVAEDGVQITTTFDECSLPGFHGPRLVADLLDHCLAELALRPHPRVLRVHVVAEPGGVAVRFTHNGVHRRSHRIARDAGLYQVRFQVASAGPGLGVTYVLLFPEV